MSDLASTSEKDGGPDFAFPMEDAPKDGSVLRLLVKFDRKSAVGAFVDTTEPSWTIGTNNMANTGDDQWDIVGWSWEQDVFCNAYGATALGWLPFHSENNEPSALASPAPAESGEAVAWMWPHMLWPKTARQFSATDPGNVHGKVPLYLHPPAESAGSPSTSGVGVKPLEWEGIAATSMWAHQKWASSVQFWWTYRITLRADRMHQVRLEGVKYGDIDLGWFATWDDAKSAAQADFDARILSAIVYPSDPSRDTQPALLSTDETKEGGNG